MRRYAALKADGVEAIAAFAADVRSGAFPAEEETYHLPAAVGRRPRQRPAASAAAGETSATSARSLGLYGGATISG